MKAGEVEAERARVAGELREIAVLVESMRAEVERSRAREELAGERFAALREVLAPEGWATAEERIAALDRRAAMSAELASLEAKQALLARLDLLLRGLDAAAAPAPTQAPAQAPAHDESALLRAVAATQEEERRRIARAVHDGPAQAMANVVLQSEISERVFGIDPASARTELAALRAMVNKTLLELRGFIFELRPMILDDLGLVPTLRRYVQTVVDKHGVKIDFTSTGRDRRLPSADEVSLFRLLQDALVERVQHARATEVALAMTWGDEALEIQVRSDGGLAGTRGGLTSGLSRQERVSLLGGTLTEEERGGRVTLTVRIPLRAAPQLGA